MKMQENRIVLKNRQDWEQYSAKYLEYHHHDRLIQPIVQDPSKACHATVWKLLNQYAGSFSGLHICVPSSGDNHAVFAFALLGAEVTSCDISENQLRGGQSMACRLGIEDRIRFVQSDTMALESLCDAYFDMVYTSNGVHVWLNDLPAMYRNIHRSLKPGGLNVLSEIHPFQRPFGQNLQIKQPSDDIGPHEDEYTINFSWRIQDFINAITGAGLRIEEMAEMFDEKNYDAPFFLRHEEIIHGKRTAKEEVDRMYDWHTNPAMALPQWMCLVNRK